MAFFSKNVSVKGVFFGLGNADMSYLIYLSAGTGPSQRLICRCSIISIHSVFTIFGSGIEISISDHKHNNLFQ